MENVTKEQALLIYETEIWKNWNSEEIVEFQLFQKRLCVPFHVFHTALEKILERPVWIHELGRNYDGIVEEYFGMRKKARLDEIINLIPENKRILI